MMPLKLDLPGGAHLRIGYRSPGLTAELDPTNFYLGGSDPLDIFHDFDDRIASGHIKDAVYCTEWKGEVPMSEGEMANRDARHLVATGMRSRE